MFRTYPKKCKPPRGGCTSHNSVNMWIHTNFLAVECNPSNGTDIVKEILELTQRKRERASEKEGNTKTNRHKKKKLKNKIKLANDEPLSLRLLQHNIVRYIVALGVPLMRIIIFFEQKKTTNTRCQLTS